MSYSFRNRPSLSERLKGKSTDEIIQEMKNSFDESRRNFFSKSKPSWGGSSRSTSSGTFPFDNDSGDFDSHLDKLVEQHPDLAEPLQSWRENTRDNKKKKTEDSRVQEEEEEREQPSPLKTNFRNTVPNMQQRREQEENEEERGQRSRSAPPGSEQAKHFVSGEGKTDEENKREPVVRHIPIYVEGRDEPVLPKGVDPSPRPRHREPSPVSKQPYSSHDDRPHGTNSHTSERRPLNVSPNTSEKQIPIQINSTHPTRGGVQIPIHVVPEPKSTPEKVTPDQSRPIPDLPKQAPKPVKLDPIEKVNLVQEEVTSLMKQVEDYKGNSRSDKDYIYLDEMLTRNLLKLDDIETEGKEDVRVARREAIRMIQRCISTLESKAAVDEKTEEESNSKPKEERLQNRSEPENPPKETNGSSQS